VRQNRPNFFGWALLAMLATACADSKDPTEPADGVAGAAGTSEADASTVAGSSGAPPPLQDAAAADGAGPSGAAGSSSRSCSDDIGSCPARPADEFKVLLDATEFGPDAHFIAMGDQALVVAVGDGTFRIALLLPPVHAKQPVPAYAAWAFPTDDLQPIDATAIPQPVPSDAGKVFVLACDVGRTHCAVLAGDSGQNELQPWQNADLPSGFMPRRMVFDTAADPQALCVYGNGLLCFESGWQQAIPPSADLRLNDVAIGSGWSLAVGDHGRWFKREASDASGAWLEQTSLDDVALTGVSVFGAGGVITGEGRIQAALGEEQALFGCPAPKELVSLMLFSNSPGWAYALSSSGEVFLQSPMEQQDEPYCAFQQLMLGAVLETGIAPCYDDSNPRVLTDRLLLGQNLCIISD
jgi:hypothetical protein